MQYMLRTEGAGRLTGKFIAYYRVSTAKQGASGLGLAAQQHAVREYLNGGRWKLLEEITEVESGKNSDRPRLARALCLCRLRGATLVVAKLDRLARNAHFLSGLMESGVDFVACDMPSANNLTVHVLAAAAEAVAHAISARTRAALAAAKARGTVLGGDRGNLTDALRTRARRNSAVVRKQQAARRAADVLPIIEKLRSDGATSLRQIASALTEHGNPAPRGGAWQATQVRRVLAAAPVAA
jgi:DNA invertase Pin-like site-specific DNA recombinase